MVSTGGIVISKHFCGGELEIVSFYKKVSSCCCGEESEITKVVDEDDCCQDVESFSKLKTDQISKTAKIVLGNQIFFYTSNDIFLFQNRNKKYISTQGFTIPNGNSPPKKLDNKLYLTYHQLKLFDFLFLS
jgi:hypothetical protein